MLRGPCMLAPPTAVLRQAAVVAAPALSPAEGTQRHTSYTSHARHALLQPSRVVKLHDHLLQLLNCRCCPIAQHKLGVLQARPVVAVFMLQRGRTVPCKHAWLSLLMQSCDE